MSSQLIYPVDVADALVSATVREARDISSGCITEAVELFRHGDFRKRRGNAWTHADITEQVRDLLRDGRPFGLSGLVREETAGTQEFDGFYEALDGKRIAYDDGQQVPVFYTDHTNILNADLRELDVSLRVAGDGTLLANSPSGKTFVESSGFLDNGLFFVGSYGGETSRVASGGERVYLIGFQHGELCKVDFTADGEFELKPIQFVASRYALASTVDVRGANSRSSYGPYYVHLLFGRLR